MAYRDRKPEYYQVCVRPRVRLMVVAVVVQTRKTKV